LWLLFTDAPGDWVFMQQYERAFNVARTYQWKRPNPALVDNHHPSRRAYLSLEENDPKGALDKTWKAT
jgi:hypothetical protein